MAGARSRRDRQAGQAAQQQPLAQRARAARCGARAAHPQRPLAASQPFQTPAQPPKQPQRAERGRLAQAPPRAVEQSAHGLAADTHHVGGLLVASPLDRRQDHRGPLLARQLCHCAQRIARSHGRLQRARRRPALDAERLGGERIDAAPGGASGSAQGRDGRVVDDPVQPRSRLAHLRAPRQRQPGPREALLNGVLAAVLRQAQPPAVASQRLAVAGGEHVEGAVLAGSRQRRQPSIRLRVERSPRKQQAHRRLLPALAGLEHDWTDRRAGLRSGRLRGPAHSRPPCSASSSPAHEEARSISAQIAPCGVSRSAARCTFAPATSEEAPQPEEG